MDTELSSSLSTHCSDIVSGVEAEFAPLKDFGYRWGTMPDGKVKLVFSDYLADAPEDVVMDFGRMAVLRAKRMDWSTPQSFLDHIATDSFITNHRPTFVARSKNLTRSDMGEHRFLPDSVQRLLDSGLLTPDDVDNSWFSWTRRDNVRRLGFCSTMFRVVGISSILDSPDVSTDAVDFVVYHESLHLRQGYRDTRRVHDSTFRSWERAYPGYDAVIDELRHLGDL